MIVIQSSANYVDPIPLGKEFWAFYIDADYGVGLSGSDVTSWASLINSADIAVPLSGYGNPQLGSIGSRTAVNFNITAPYTQSMWGPDLNVADGNDTPFTVAMHADFTTTNNQPLWAFCYDSGNGNRYYLLQLYLNSPTYYYPRGYDGTTLLYGDTGALFTTSEHTVVFVRHCDTYDIAVDGTRVVTGGAMALASMTMNKFTIAARHSGGGIPNGSAQMKLRRIAFAQGSGITDAKIAKIHDTWYGK